MGIREFIEKQKKFMVPAVGVLTVACAYSGWRSYRSTELPGMVERAFYSDDDGKTYFPDDVKKGFSFDHDGKQAYRAFVYRGGSGKVFVGLLARTGEPSKATAPVSPNTGRKSQGLPPPVEVRKPGDSKWVSSLSREYQPLLQSIAPGENPDIVLP
jgi:hypothetical protein